MLRAFAFVTLLVAACAARSEQEAIEAHHVAIKAHAQSPRIKVASWNLCEVGDEFLPCPVSSAPVGTYVPAQGQDPDEETAMWILEGEQESSKEMPNKWLYKLDPLGWVFSTKPRNEVHNHIRAAGLSREEPPFTQLKTALKGIVTGFPDDPSQSALGYNSEDRSEPYSLVLSFGDEGDTVSEKEILHFEHKW
eukprot:gnl/TRDRNA2_/TRDRNA2_42019_c0_seq1.p1 gnl/TRDRNA2_/TRDRNA2_42019_c0~~gnl/TRDRNA2_/TRDRNA2_42019_c0_seq1.p1  ORF type:complete len:193 (+),score=24.23 gnl/TRDRNA2_/TRDRNA2_42019_c0_seq1:59-637(+)